MKRYFTTDHEWFDLEGDIATVGITDHAQSLLGDIVFVELPNLGQKVQKSDAVAVVESVKAASDVYSPLAGEVTEVNALVSQDPSAINTGAESVAWLFRLRIEGQLNSEDLMDEETYTTTCI